MRDTTKATAARMAASNEFHAARLAERGWICIPPEVDVYISAAPCDDVAITCATCSKELGDGHSATIRELATLATAHYKEKHQ